MRTHEITARPDTVHWGYFDYRLEPVLTVPSGDRLIVHSLSISCYPDLLPDDPSRYPGEEMAAIYEGVRHGVGPHTMVGPVAVEGDSAQTGFESDHALALPGLSAERIGRGAAEMATAKLGAGSYGTRRVELVLAPRVTAGLFGALAPALYADNVLKGKSLFAQRLGETVATESLTLVDDGTLKGGGKAAPIDGEGVVMGETSLIREGTLTGYLHSTYTARKMGAQSTGNSVRGSYHSPPRVGSTNLYPRPGDLSREELLAEVADGLYISEVMGLHTINPISGEYSIGALGWVIVRGELTEAVEGIAIAGNVLDLLGSVMAVASDLRLFYHGGGGATVLLEGVSVSGK